MPAPRVPSSRPASPLAPLAPVLLVLALLMPTSLTGLLAGPALAAPAVGESLPPLNLLPPDRPEDLAALGLAPGPAPGPGNRIQLADLRGAVVLIEIIGVYCPFCHQQTPLFNGLLSRLRRAKLDEAVTMLAVASGATAPEIEFLRGKSQYDYPVLRDEDFALHKALGEPKTPCTLLVDKQGVVRFVHTGVIQDIDGLFATIKQLAK